MIITTPAAAIADLLLSVTAALPAAAGGGLFDTLTRLLADATVVVKAAGVLVGIIVALMGIIASRGRVPGILMGIIAGGLVIWGVFSGVDWFSQQVGTEITGTAPAVAAPTPGVTPAGPGHW